MSKKLILVKEIDFCAQCEHCQRERFYQFGWEEAPIFFAVNQKIYNCTHPKLNEPCEIKNIHEIPEWCPLPKFTVFDYLKKFLSKRRKR